MKQICPPLHILSAVLYLPSMYVCWTLDDNLSTKFLAFLLLFSLLINLLRWKKALCKTFDKSKIIPGGLTSMEATIIMTVTTIAAENLSFTLFYKLIGMLWFLVSLEVSAKISQKMSSMMLKFLLIQAIGYLFFLVMPYL